MNAATNNSSNSALPARSSQRDARSWIERQLKWEHTLETLRGKVEQAPQRRAA